MLHYCFHWWSSSLLEPSNRSIKSLYKKSSNEILAVQDRFPNRFNRGPWCPDPCHTQPVRYESTNKPTITTLLSLPRRGGRKNTIEQRKRGRTLLNREGEEERYWTNIFNYRPLYSPRIKATTIFFLEIQVLSVSFFSNSFLLDTTFFGPMLHYNVTVQHIYHNAMRLPHLLELA